MVCECVVVVLWRCGVSIQNPRVSIQNVPVCTFKTLPCVFDDVEWIRSLTEAQEVTSGIPEDSVTYEQQEDPQKVFSANSDGRVLAEKHLAATFGTHCGRNCSPHGIDPTDRSGHSRWR